MNAEQAYAETDRITRETARNFAWGIRVLPGPKRRAIAALYAFARRVDDLADRPEPARAELESWQAAVQSLPAPQDGDAILVALADAMERYAIPRQALLDLVAGALMDCEHSRYEDWDALREYCRCVAGAVGVACAAVYEPTSWEAARPRAETLGLALQQINIMRDVAEDWSLGRVYLPTDELEAFAVLEEDIGAGLLTPQLQALLAFQAERARVYLDDGLHLLDQLDRRSALCVGAFAGLYRATLERIEESGFDVFAGPPHLSPLVKLRIVGGGLWR